MTDIIKHQVQKFYHSFFINSWGTVGSEDGEFFVPTAVGVDSMNNVYVADAVNHRIQKFDSNGNFILKWGSSGSGEGQFAYPTGIAVDAENNVYVTDRDNDNIQKFTSSGTFVNRWGTSDSGNGQFNEPYGIAIDSDGNIYVSNRDNNSTQKLDGAVPISVTFKTFYASLCPTERLVINITCRAGRRTLVDDVTIAEYGNISQAVFAYNANNKGRISNSTIKIGATLRGGILSGYIVNQGTIADFEFRGAKVTGGTLAGTVINASPIGGSFVDVTLAANTIVRGGSIKGDIKGDCEAPARLEDLKVKNASQLECVIIGDDVELASDVVFGEGVQIY